MQSPALLCFVAANIDFQVFLLENQPPARLSVNFSA